MESLKIKKKFVLPVGFEPTIVNLEKSCIIRLCYGSSYPIDVLGEREILIPRIRNLNNR